MAKLGAIIFTGASGTKYNFDVYSIDTKFDDVGAVYFFTKRIKKDGQDKYTHTKHIYVGQTGDLSERFEDHHKMPCIKKNGANCICIHVESNASKRTEIESDLIAAYKPVCND